MWQGASKKANANNRNKLRVPIHFRRVDAKLELDPPIGEHPKSDIRIFLNDLNPNGVGIFSPTSLLAGQKVNLSFEVPMTLTIKGRVIWCQDIHFSSHILSNHNAYHYRLGIEFKPETPEETQKIKDFCIQAKLQLDI